MTLQTTDPRMIEALEGASSLQLYQLKSIIEGMLADQQRGMAAGASLHLGQSVRFVDFRDGQMRSGKIIAFKDTQATVLEQGTKRTWKIPCVAMQGYTDAERQQEQTPYVPPPEPAAAPTLARAFQQGDTATFTDRDGRAITGVVVRVNQRTATIGTGDGSSWRVPFHLLRHVLDIEPRQLSRCDRRRCGLGNDPTFAAVSAAAARSVLRCCIKCALFERGDVVTDAAVVEPLALGGTFQDFVEFLREADTPALMMSPKRFSQALHIDLQTLAEQAHVHRNTISRAPGSRGVQDFLREALRVIKAATDLNGDLNKALF